MNIKSDSNQIILENIEIVQMNKACSKYALRRVRKIGCGLGYTSDIIIIEITWRRVLKKLVQTIIGNQRTLTRLYLMVSK